MGYTWSKPKFEAGDFVMFEDAWGQMREGQILDVETTYDREMVAEHSYDIWIPDPTPARRRRYTAPEHNIRKVHRPRKSGRSGNDED